MLKFLASLYIAVLALAALPTDGRPAPQASAPAKQRGYEVEIGVIGTYLVIPWPPEAGAAKTAAKTVTETATITVIRTATPPVADKACTPTTMTPTQTSTTSDIYTGHSQTQPSSSEAIEPTASYSSIPGNWEDEMLQQVNAIRAEAGRPPLRIDKRLCKAAQAHSDYQASINDMTHSNPVGGLKERCAKYGVTGNGFAENIASHRKDVTQVVTAWKESPGHYKNMIGDYNIAGFGVRSQFWTQEFVKENAVDVS
ncbi:hypothetical protein GGF46_002088 [Coemansia sp. RSA 552]|nr:hypothetical protein GGF46_002088 [Coemansia sp. RSA 552]